MKNPTLWLASIAISSFCSLSALAEEPAPAATPEKEPMYPVTSFVQDLQISGFLDTTYNYNFKNPTEDTNVARVFDNESDSFNINAAKLVLQKPLSETSPFGFQIHALAGNDAELIHSLGLGESSDSFDLEQAFFEFNAPTSRSLGINDLNVKIGKFVTLAGAEVIESKDDWNTSRSLLFGFAIPFTHTGARATYTFDSGVDIILGVNNGWDVTDDNNDAKTIETHIGSGKLALPGDSELTLTVQGYFGPEGEDNNSAWRSVVDTVATYSTPWKPLTLMYNFDYADEDDALEDGGSANWYGHALYAKIDLDDSWAVVGRAEYFKDSDGVRIVSGTPAEYTEFTATIDYRPWKGVITRAEFRYDHADEEVFNDDDSELTKDQQTISAEVIYSF